MYGTPTPLSQNLHLPTNRPLSLLFLSSPNQTHPQLRVLRYDVKETKQNYNNYIHPAIHLSHVFLKSSCLIHFPRPIAHTH